MLFEKLCMKGARCIGNIIVYINSCIDRSPKVGNYFQLFKESGLTFGSDLSQSSELICCY